MATIKKLLVSEANIKEISEATGAQSPAVLNALERLAGRTTANLEREAFLTVDASAFLGPPGKEIKLPLPPGRTISSLLDELWALLNVPPFTYRTLWLLREKGGRMVFDQMGTAWARAGGRQRDERQVVDVGIRPGMTLEVVKLKEPSYGSRGIFGIDVCVVCRRTTPPDELHLGICSACDALN